ncbi:MAG TPA: YbjN domain-containing protein [Sporichthya sp.]|nr:YbjN domain-containing protein [Sporichthya sp.]
MTQQAAVSELLRRELDALELDWTEARPGLFVVTLPGTKKLSTTCSLAVGAHSVTLNAFVARRPDENHREVYRWLLERNARMYGVAFMVDKLGDIYLTGRVSPKALDATEIDRLLGSDLEYADGSFNPILERGFASSIRKEHAWRVSRGESTANLDAFRHLLDAADPSGADQD